MEKQLQSDTQEMSHNAVGMLKDPQTGTLSIVKLKYDAESKFAAVVEVAKQETKDQLIVFNRTHKFLVEEIFRKITGGK